MKISNEVLAVLEKADTDGTKLFLGPPGSLDRKLYTETNKALEAMGGRWNKSAKAHVFDGDAATVVEQLIDTGEYSNTKQDFGQFDSPPAVVNRLLELAELLPDMNVLEPSAGLGNIVAAVEAAGARVTAFEVDAKRLHAVKNRCLLAGGIHLIDFLSAKPEGAFDRVIMNPPFAGQTDIDHVLHASKFLNAGGCLVSVMSASVTFRSNRKTVEFRDIVARRGGAIEMLPEDAFAESGTAVKTCIVTIGGEA